METWVFPEGKFVLKAIKQTENVYLPHPFKLMDKKAPGLTASVKKTETGKLFNIDIKKAGSGIQAIFYVMNMQNKYSLGTVISGPENGKVELLVSRSKNSASAFFKKKIITSSEMKRYDFPNAVIGKNCAFFLFLKFNTAGKYSIKEVNIY